MQKTDNTTSVCFAFIARSYLVWKGLDTGFTAAACFSAVQACMAAWASIPGAVKLQSSPLQTAAAVHASNQKAKTGEIGTKAESDEQPAAGYSSQTCTAGPPCSGTSNKQGVPSGMGQQELEAHREEPLVQHQPPEAGAHLGTDVHPAAGTIQGSSKPQEAQVKGAGSLASLTYGQLMLVNLLLCVSAVIASIMHVSCRAQKRMI